MTHQEMICLHGQWQVINVPNGHHYEYTPRGWVLRRNPSMEPRPAPPRPDSETAACTPRQALIE